MSHDAIEAHEEVGELAMILSVIMGLASGVAAVAFWKKAIPGWVACSRRPRRSRCSSTRAFRAVRSTTRRSGRRVWRSRLRLGAGGVRHTRGAGRSSVPVRHSRAAERHDPLRRGRDGNPARAGVAGGRFRARPASGSPGPPDRAGLHPPRSTNPRPIPMSRRRRWAGFPDSRRPSVWPAIPPAR